MIIEKKLLYITTKNEKAVCFCRYLQQYIICDASAIPLSFHFNSAGKERESERTPYGISVKKIALNIPMHTRTEFVIQHIYQWLIFISIFTQIHFPFCVKLPKNLSEIENRTVLIHQISVKTSSKCLLNVF